MTCRYPTGMTVVPANEDKDSPPSSLRLLLTLTVLAASVSSFALLQSLIIPVLTTFENEFGTDQVTVTWLLTAYLLSASVAAPLLGRIGDAVGKRRMLVITLLVLSLGSLMAALAPSIGWLIAARAVQGAGGAVLPLSLGIARDEFGDRTMTALSTLTALASGGFAAGIVLAGPIVDSLGYRGLFWLPMAATLGAALAAILAVPESPVRTRERLPVAPAILLCVWLAAALLVLSEGGTWGWTSARVIGLAVLASASFAGWLAAETHVRVPFIDIHMMRRRGVWTSNVLAFCMGFSMFASYGFLPQFLQAPEEAGYGFDATIAESGWILTPSATMALVVGFSSVLLIRALGPKLVILAGVVSMFSAFVAFALWHDAAWQLGAAALAQGIGVGLLSSAVAWVVVTSVPVHQTGVAGGMNANLRTIGGAMGSAVMAVTVSSQHGASGLPTENGYVAGFLMLAAVMVPGAVVAVFVPRPTHSPIMGSHDGAGLEHLALQQTDSSTVVPVHTTAPAPETTHACRATGSSDGRDASAHTPP